MQRDTISRYLLLLLAGFVCLGIVTLRADTTAYLQHNLVSDIPGLADFTDPNLLNPWGIAFSPTSPFWVCDNRAGLSTLYDGSGKPSSLVVTIPPPMGSNEVGKCTGIVFNSSSGFAVESGLLANYIFATENGTISAWNSKQADSSHAIQMVDNSATAVYKGLAIGSNGAGVFLYAANFRAGTIDVFDSNFARAMLQGSFSDASVPAGFAPFNIQNLGGKLYVTYAMQDPSKTFDIAGPGNGYVAVFDTDGNLLQHLISNGKLNSPWGIQIAPASFGAFSNDLLIGNFGDGAINAYELDTGIFVGVMQDAAGSQIINKGLWGLQFGNGGSGGDPNTLYFTAGIAADGAIQDHGLLGSIKPAPDASGIPKINDGGVVNNASYSLVTQNVAPGSIAAIFGTNLTDGSSCLPPACNPAFDNDGKLMTAMAGAEVTVNGAPVPIFYASPEQLGIQMPTEMADSTARVTVTIGGQTSSQTIAVDPVSPGIFSFTADGKGPGAITHADGTPVSPQDPAQAGEVIIIYATGLGMVTPPVPTGGLPNSISTTLAAVTVMIDGLPVTPDFAGLAGCCVGLNQVNVQVPVDIRSSSGLSVALSVAGKQSNAVTLPTEEEPPPPPPPYDYDY